VRRLIRRLWVRTDQLLEQFRALLVGEPIGATQQPESVDPLQVALASTSHTGGFGGASADLVDPAVGGLMTVGLGRARTNGRNTVDRKLRRCRR
jgi:hypothetical protein